MSALIRPAKTSDIKKIRTIIDAYVSERRLLSKETVTLFESVQEFIVAEVDAEVVGCGALHVLWEDLAEVRTVAVIESMQGKGIGHTILENILARAKGLQKYRAHQLNQMFMPNYFAHMMPVLLNS
jgi:amino-acid N-acetyltransferase